MARNLADWRTFRNLWAATTFTLAVISGAANAQQPSISVPTEIAVAPAVATRLPVEILNTAAVSERSVLYVIGLPEGSSFNVGFKITKTSWAVPIARLEGLSLTVRDPIETPIEAGLSVLTPDGDTVAKGATMLFSMRDLPATRQAIAKQSGPRDGAGADNARPADVSGAQSAATVAAPPRDAASTSPATVSNRSDGREPTRAETASDAGAASDTSAAIAGTQTAALTPPIARPVRRLPKPLPAMTQEERSRADRLMRRGDQMLSDGNVNAARHFYQRAAEIGLADAASALAATYDAQRLRRLGAIGVEPNPTIAATWLSKAKELRARDTRAAR